MTIHPLLIAMLRDLKQVRDGTTASKAYWTAARANAAGQVTEALLGNGVRETRTYDANTGALLTLQTGPGWGIGRGSRVNATSGGGSVSPAGLTRPQYGRQVVEATAVFGVMRPQQI